MSTSLYLDPQRAAPVWQEPARTGGPEGSPESEEWIAQARCRQNDPDALFVQGAEQRRAATLCQPCPVRTQCLVTSLDNREEFGVWGGLTERQRRALLRKNPHIDDWADYLATGGKLIDI
ncbi:Transcriptional regulator WhiB4 [Corynebacterium occultum]|uniref:Transcriptional regulator WhiB n=1 Tax=Corynebacterium occultum TaxID=2675219 RepID=A0A6B8W6H7_9CORY|nr:WhiB family transcriptional regulator [Corynebacterium occultum]QGU06915.1 Transcriptional regulator WhiB4 [Corynebacterium occultum]